MICPDCSANLEVVPIDQPCPSCGGTRCGPVVAVTGVCGAVVTAHASTSVGYGPVRPWQEKWHDISCELTDLSSMFSTAGRSNDVVRRQVESFFKDCREFADWLKHHAGVPEAMAYVHSDPDLVICDGMAQTSKHHTRSGTGQMTVRVTWVYDGGASAEIEWTRPSGASGTEDALDLAVRCVAAWQRFLEQRHLFPLDL